MIVWAGLLALISVVENTTDRSFMQFGSRACPPCQMIQPVMDQLHSEGWSIRYIDTEQDRVTVQRYSIRQTPTVIVFEHGREVDRIVGYLPRVELRKRLIGNDFPDLDSSTVAPQRVAPPSIAPPVASPPIRTAPESAPTRDSAVEPANKSRHISGPSRWSTLGKNHPLSRSNPSAQSASKANRRSRVDNSLGDVKQAMMGINHPLYSRYRGTPAEPSDALGRQGEPTLRERLPIPPKPVHPLLEGLVPLPESPQSLAATVRIQVDYGDSKSVGTGTIIHTAGNQALVLTCAHLFRDRNSAVPVTVELFGEGAIVCEPGVVVKVCEGKVDLALIRFRSSAPLTKVAILHKGEQLQEHDRVFSIGCDAGADPTRRESKISKLNRHLGTSNVEAAGAPVQGRSGGGLFDAQARLVGVCYASDSVLDEGLYVGPEAIHAELEKFRLNWLIEGKNLPTQNSIGPAK